jgi:hypothetical protein
MTSAKRNRLNIKKSPLYVAHIGQSKSGSIMNELNDLIRYLARERNNFEKPRSPVEFNEQIALVDKAIPTRFCFHRSAKWVREGISLGQYAELSNAPWIRLNRADPPDGYTSETGSSDPIEHTFVFDPEYRPDQFYKGSSNILCREGSDDRVGDVCKALQIAIDKKVESALTHPNYPIGTTLVLDLNMGSEGKKFEIEKIIRRTLEHELAPFAQVRCVWLDRLY